MRGVSRASVRGAMIGVALTLLVAVAAVGLPGDTPTADSGDLAAFGPEVTYSGCLLGGKLTKVWSKDTNPERCETVVNAAGKVAKYATWSATGPEGPMGPEGATGEPGPQGPPGESGVPDFYVKEVTFGPPAEPPDPPPERDMESVNLLTFEPGALEALCDPGDAVMSAEFREFSENVDVWGNLLPPDPDWDAMKEALEGNWRETSIMFVPIVDAVGTPIGFTNLRERSLGYGKSTGWDSASIWITSLHGELICADLTP